MTNAYGLIYVSAVLGATYGLAAAMDPDSASIYYLSDMFSYPFDTPAVLVVRWALWLSVPLVTWETLSTKVRLGVDPHRTGWLKIKRSRLVGECAAVANLVVWWLLIFSGLDARAFGGARPSEGQRVFHFVCAGLLLGVYGFLLLLARFRIIGTLWLLTSLPYGVLFLMARENRVTVFPTEFYIALEYVYYVIFVVAILGWKRPEVVTTS